MHLIIDTETTGKCIFDLPVEHASQPNLVQVGAILYDDAKNIRGELNAIIKPDGWTIPAEASAVHGITQELAEAFGIPLRTVLSVMKHFMNSAKVLSSFNWSFDSQILETAFFRIGQTIDLHESRETFCTMAASTNLCKIPSLYGSGFKWPKLSEAYRHFFNADFEGAHDAMADVRAAARIYFHLRTEVAA